MAVQKIEYENKTYLQNDPNIPEKNKVTEANMNEIKSKVNNNADELSTAQQNIEDLQAGQGTVSSDITSLKNRVTTLEGDNTKNKQDIANKVDKVEGKGLSTEDYTTAEKEKLAGLNNYDDTEIKKDIQDLESDVSDIKSEQETQNDLLQRTQNALINITTPKSSNINVKDSSDLNAKIDVYGISEQDGEPSPSNIVDIENVTGDIDITVCNKNFFDENNTNNFKYGVGDDFTTKNDDGTFKTIANFSLGRNKGTKIVGLKANTDYIVSLDIKNITSTATSKAAEVEIIENAEKISIVMQKDFKNLGINTLEFNSGSYQDLSLHISGYTYSEVSKSVSVTFADVLIAEKSNDNSYVEHEQQVTTFPLKENQKMMEGSRTENDGIHHKRKQITLTGNEQIVKYTKTFTNGYGYRIMLADVKANTKVLSSIYNYENFQDFYWADDITNKITTHNEVGGYVLVGSSKATIEEFRQEIAGSVLEYETIEETIEEYTEEQQTAYNQLQSAKTYKTVTNVFTENAEVEMEYIAHTKTYVDNEIKPLKEQINTINQLLSTTNTSALLLDNLQTDLESEVL